MTLSTYPFVSIIVPSYNAHRTMSLCIESLLALDYPKDRYEIIIVDNNSTDDTADIIKQYTVKYLLQDKIQTSYASRNCAIEVAKGDILAFTDSDCIAHPDWLKEGIKPFDNPNVVGMGGNVLSYKPEHYIEKYQDRKQVFDRSHAMSQDALANGTAVLITANAFYRRSLFSEIGMFVNNITGGGDREFSYRIQRNHHGKLVYNPNAIIYHKHRTTLRNFWEQYYRYGYNSRNSVVRYYPEQVSNYTHYGFIRPLYWQIRFNLFGQGADLMVHAFRYALKHQEEDKIRLIDTFLDGIRKWASFLGEFRASIKNKQSFFSLSFSGDSMDKNNNSDNITDN